jgi:hypothetical protein
MAWLRWSRRRWGPIPTAAMFSSSGRNGTNKRHSAYSFRRATIAYPWHPLFGRTLQVSRNRRGKDLTCIYTDERPDLARELPNWMFDEKYCAGMSLGLPQVSIEALNALAVLLTAAGSESAKRGSRSGPSEAKEPIRGKEKETGSKTTRAASRTAAPDSVSGAPEREGTDRGAGRPPARGDRRANDGTRGQRGRRP